MESNKTEKISLIKKGIYIVLFIGYIIINLIFYNKNMRIENYVFRCFCYLIFFLSLIVYIFIDTIVKLKKINNKKGLIIFLLCLFVLFGIALIYSCNLLCETRINYEYANNNFKLLTNYYNRNSDLYQQLDAIRDSYRNKVSNLEILFSVFELACIVVYAFILRIFYPPKKAKDENESDTDDYYNPDIEE